ncbi:helix-turn-helix domain-containing protein [Nonomuraea sp. CA-141351]|uniref:helix-turn-helix domain-containing protein n=1 Tax=Nonomuraea sp. CA-141351 TaxID=3239996 RepID=UPI003D8A605C
MIKTVFRSDCVPAAERLARFDELQVNGKYPMHALSDRPEDFRATAQELYLAGVNVTKVTCSPLDVQRTPKLIRDKDPELYSVVFAARGEVGVAQADREATLRAHDFALYDSSRPSLLRIGAARGTTTVVCMHVPRSLLRLPASSGDDLMALSLPGRSGVGALLTQFLTGLITGAARYRESDVPRLRGVAVDLLTAALAHHLDAADEVPDDSRQRVLLLRAEAFARAHLHEPHLSPGTVAAAVNISVSYLHRLFRTREITFSAWIRHQRLERARRDLADPALRTVPVHRIAAQCGFNDHATFTRAFRAAYHVSPRDYRELTLRLPA